MKLDFFPVITPEGRMKRVECKPRDLYEQICEHVGSPFDVARIEGAGFQLYVHDESLINEMPMNLPLALVLALPVCGPAMLVGPPDERGDTTYPVLPEGLLPALTSVCIRLTEVSHKINTMRNTPPQIITDEEEIARFFGDG